MKFNPLSPAKIACLFIILTFWLVGLINLSASPNLHNDEVSIFAAGWQLFETGQYALPMYTSFYEQERIYLEILPLMSLLQGAGSALWGAGVLQMRFLPLIYGVLTIALTFQLGKKVANEAVGLCAVMLLISWQWAYPTPPFLLTGIPLIDLTRIGRYDILIAPLTLLILLSFLRHRYVLCGFCIGLTLLTHLYVIFWLPIITLLWWVLSDRKVQILAKIYLTAFITVLPWMLIMAFNLPQTVGQLSKHGGRFSLNQFAFYLSNIQTELQRYHLGLTNSATWTRLGLWLLIIGVPLVLIALVRSNNRMKWAILIPVTAFPLAFALLISKKNMGYSLAFLPIVMVAVAWQLTRWWHQMRWSRGLIALVAIGVLAQGASAIRFAQSDPSPPSYQFFAELNQVIPPNSVIMGPQTYWIGLYAHEFRTFYLPFLRALPTQQNPVAFKTTLEQQAPTIFISNQTLIDSFLATKSYYPSTASFQMQFDSFMYDHQAKLIATLQDHEGLSVEVYQLDY